ncbi:MAG: cytochrome c peroxidase [Verrucomicrobiales bacterium]|jgi:cytochrome c peroxidase
MKNSLFYPAWVASLTLIQGATAQLDDFHHHDEDRFRNEFHPDGDFRRSARIADDDFHQNLRETEHHETAPRSSIANFPAPINDSDFHHNGRPPFEKVLLGRLLFFDNILSGNRNISCATCHHPRTATSDALSLGIGEGGEGIGLQRSLGYGSDAVEERIPRNSPALFNLGAREYTVLFHDGRVAKNRSEASGFKSPAGSQLPKGLENALAAQAMFPVTSAAEMAGQKGENPIANAAAAEKFAGQGGVWDLLADRIREIPEYAERFHDAFPTEIRSGSDIRFVHVANAIAAYETVAFRADESPFDEYLRGRDSLSAAEIRGMDLFFGRANCASCHSGDFLTDHEFHAIGMPQIGPGKGDGYGGHDDFGRENASKSASDRYKFRTPALRNVALTGPWGHSGAFTTLEEVVDHHADPGQSLRAFNPNSMVLPSRSDLDALDLLAFKNSSSRNSLETHNVLPRKILTKAEIRDLVAFLEALTDRYSIDLRAEIPERVPSGLPVDR